MSRPAFSSTLKIDVFSPTSDYVQKAIIKRMVVITGILV